ncbi:hypothetical protein ABZ490_29500 [Streptomyces sp. NPDC005811]|uniref:hypothetical protein n=1 Tax=Streptomyces sp. NPDC005811 TaxID=3154565 RepID=UPI0033EF5B97
MGVRRTSGLRPGVVFCSRPAPTTSDRLRQEIANGDFVYCTIRRLDGEHIVRTRWRTLDTTRQHRFRPPGGPPPA